MPDALYVPDTWVCGACFEVYFKPDAQLCPKDGTPLQRLTWEARAKALEAGLIDVAAEGLRLLRDGP